MLSPFMAQLQKVKKAYAKIESVYKGTMYIKPMDWRNELWEHFCITCHHMIDYAIEDGTINLNKTGIYDYVKNNYYLSICADLCNKSKHHKITKSIYCSEDPEFPTTFLGTLAIPINQKLEKGTTIKIFIDKTPCITRENYQIKLKSGKLDFLEFASKCLEAWIGFKDKYYDN